ncbi:Hypothetical predicted protein [Paramuricea clavata]|uniref:Uncharacterized protein n=1 Tax=Paramuricea clavata TaxID=317549 RepID=A0A6S7H4Y7_PARCT|nr:Hypothetical predicted protein [Paramuricea clavata]
MMKRIMGNIDLMKSVRAAYKAREAFDVHNTRRHREQTSLKDKVKAMWFCLKEGFFVNHTSEGENDITSYSSCGKTMKVTPSLIDGYSKGVAKFKLVFKERLFKYFGQHETCIESEDDEDDEELGVC